jgi:hypothetical protein
MILDLFFCTYLKQILLNILMGLFLQLAANN